MPARASLSAPLIIALGGIPTNSLLSGANVDCAAAFRMLPHHHDCGVAAGPAPLSAPASGGRCTCPLSWPPGGLPRGSIEEVAGMSSAPAGQPSGPQPALSL